jgi:diaminopimelate decarboxylase
MKNVELTGIHFHGGRHHKGLWFWRGLMKKYGLLIARLCKAWGDYQPKEIDIGGGFAASRDPFNKLGLRGDVILTYFTYPFELLLMCWISFFVIPSTFFACVYNLAKLLILS